MVSHPVSGVSQKAPQNYLSLWATLPLRIAIRITIVSPYFILSSPGNDENIYFKCAYIISDTYAEYEWMPNRWMGLRKTKISLWCQPYSVRISGISHIHTRTPSLVHSLSLTHTTVLKKNIDAKPLTTRTHVHLPNIIPHPGRHIEIVWWWWHPTIITIACSNYHTCLCMEIRSG